MPKWIQTLDKMPRSKAVVVAIGATFTVCGVFWSIEMASGKKRNYTCYYDNFPLF